MGDVTKKLFSLKNLVAIVILIIGLILVIYGSYKKWKVSQVSQWPQVRARVLNAVAEPVNSEAGTQFVQVQDLPLDVDSPARYMPRVSYSYRTAGKTYNSESFIYNEKSSYTAQEMRALLNPLQGGTTLAMYNPSDASESYMYYEGASWLTPILGVIFIIIAFGIGLYSVYQVRDEKSSKGMKYDGLQTALEQTEAQMNRYGQDIDRISVEMMQAGGGLY
jgi:uncharacterized membrane protein